MLSCAIPQKTAATAMMFSTEDPRRQGLFFTDAYANLMLLKNPLCSCNVHPLLTGAATKLGAVLKQPATAKCSADPMIYETLNRQDKTCVVRLQASSMSAGCSSIALQERPMTAKTTIASDRETLCSDDSSFHSSALLSWNELLRKDLLYRRFSGCRCYSGRRRCLQHTLLSLPPARWDCFDGTCSSRLEKLIAPVLFHTVSTRCRAADINAQRLISTAMLELGRAVRFHRIPQRHDLKYL